MKYPTIANLGVIAGRGYWQAVANVPCLYTPLLSPSLQEDKQPTSVASVDMSSFVTMSAQSSPSPSTFTQKSLTSPSREEDLQYPCDGCHRSFKTARGLIIHNNQIHPPEPWQPMKWTQTDGNGLSKAFVVHAKKRNHPSGGPLYQCPRDETHEPSPSFSLFRVRVFGGSLDPTHRYAVS